VETAAVAYHDSDRPAHLAKTQFFGSDVGRGEASRLSHSRRPHDGQLVVRVRGSDGERSLMVAASARTGGIDR
jgi:hypothetical protein